MPRIEVSDYYVGRGVAALWYDQSATFIETATRDALDGNMGQTNYNLVMRTALGIKTEAERVRRTCSKIAERAARRGDSDAICAELWEVVESIDNLELGEPAKV
jgi:hypothetical protein